MAGRSIEKALVGSALALALARSALGATDAGDWHGQILKDEIASAGELGNSLDRGEQVSKRVAQHQMTCTSCATFSTDPGDGPTRLNDRVQRPQQQIIAPSDDNRKRRRQNTRGSRE